MTTKAQFIADLDLKDQKPWARGLKAQVARMSEAEFQEYLETVLNKWFTTREEWFQRSAQRMADEAIASCGGHQRCFPGQ